MKTTVNGKKYFVCFKHTTRQGKGKNARKTYEETLCEVKTENSLGTLYIISEGVARQNFLDTPNRVVGNLEALKKATLGGLILQKVGNNVAAQLRKPVDFDLVRAQRRANRNAVRKFY